VIGSYLDPAGASITISQDLADQTGVDGKIATFKIVATGTSLYGNTVSYQWQKAAPGSSTFSDIAGANSDTYKTPLLTLADSGTKFQVVCGVPTLTKTSKAATLTVVPDTFPPVPTAGAITKSGGGVQVGVSFDEGVDATTVIAANFSLVGGGTISAFKAVANGYGDYNGAIMDVTGLSAGTTYQVNVKNVKDLKGNAIPAAGVNTSFTLGTVGWANTGTPIAPGQVVPVGGDGFDVLNGGRQEWGTYDEATIAYVTKTNDFDVKVQVVYAEPGSEWTRVGLMARNDLNVGEDPNDRNLSDGTSQVSAYAQTHVNPSQTLGSSGRWDPSDPVVPQNTTPNNGHEQNCRLGKGSTTQGWGSPGSAPPYPDAWLRLARAGAVLHGYRSSDGQNWTDQGTVTLTDQQAVMYVGPFLAVETGNIWSAAPASGDPFDVWGDPFNAKYDRLFVAQFRSFGDVVSGAAAPTLVVSRSGANITITWTGGGTLQSTDTLKATGTVWTPVAGAPASPYTAPIGATPLYFRVAQ